MSNQTTIEPPGLTMPHAREAREFARSKSVRYGLPCANCALYYSAELTACPICKCQERVSPTVTFVPSVVRL
jgi:hypothetical protein